ncbi:hypothetical protein DMENIID0001_119490 [Sergentomyia squamirostris]
MPEGNPHQLVFVGEPDFFSSIHTPIAVVVDDSEMVGYKYANFVAIPRRQGVGESCTGNVTLSAQLIVPNRHSFLKNTFFSAH